MKKLIAAVMCILFLTGCAPGNLENVNKFAGSTTFTLVSDRNTNIIYIRNRTYGTNYIYTPYYSENGKLCKLVDDRIVEINEDEE